MCCDASSNSPQATVLAQTAGGSLRVIPGGRALAGEWQPPGDLALAKRALLLGALASGQTRIKGVPECAETVAMRRVLAHLGVRYNVEDDGALGIMLEDSRLQAPKIELDCGASLTTLRLMAGLLAGQRFTALLTSDANRLWPCFDALAGYLRAMGATVECLGGAGRPPLKITGRTLNPLACTLPAEQSALKDPLLLAALSADGESCIGWPPGAPDHCERLLKHLGASVEVNTCHTTLTGKQKLRAKRLKIPGDISAAAPLIAIACAIPVSDVLIHHTGANPQRTAFIRVLTRSGVRIERVRDWQYGGEPAASFRVRGPEPNGKRGLRGFEIAPNLAEGVAAEFPLLCLLATQAKGESRLACAPALALLTPNRLALTAQVLTQFGAALEQGGDWLGLEGPQRLRGAEVQCAGDRAIGLLALAAALLADGPSTLHGLDGLHAAYPGLAEDLAGLAGAQIEAAG